MISQDIKNILEDSKNIAIVGLSPDSTKDSNIVARYLQRVGYSIIPIYPKEDFILDSKVYRSLSEAMDSIKIDIVVMFRKSEFALNLATEITNHTKDSATPKLFWMQLGMRNPKARQMLEQNNIKVIEDKCIKIEHEEINKIN